MSKYQTLALWTALVILSTSTIMLLIVQTRLTQRIEDLEWENKVLFDKISDSKDYVDWNIENTLRVNRKAIDEIARKLEHPMEINWDGLFTRYWTQSYVLSRRVKPSDIQ